MWQEDVRSLKIESQCIINKFIGEMGFCAKKKGRSFTFRPKMSWVIIENSVIAALKRVEDSTRLDLGFTFRKKSVVRDKAGCRLC